MASAANLAWLRQTNRRYIIGAPKSELKKYATELAAVGWHPIREGIEVKLARCAQTQDTIILCRSAARRRTSEPPDWPPLATQLTFRGAVCCESQRQRAPRRI